MRLLGRLLRAALWTVAVALTIFTVCIGIVIVSNA